MVQRAIQVRLFTSAGHLRGDLGCKEEPRISTEPSLGYFPSAEVFQQSDVRFAMTDFVIGSPIRILGRRGSFVRSTREPAAFMREHMDGSAPNPSQKVKEHQRGAGIQPKGLGRRQVRKPAERGGSALDH